MKSFISIATALLFLFQGLFVGLDLCCELPRFPNFFEHYGEHDEYEGASLTGFLDLHYDDTPEAEEHHHSNEHDEELPFDGHHQCSHGPIFVNSVVMHEPGTEMDLPSERQLSFYYFSLAPAYLDLPFQPPRS